MGSLDVLPIAMIPAVCLIILTLNMRLMPLLNVLGQLSTSEKRSNPNEEINFLQRVRFLQAGILCAYSAILFFVLAAFFIILSTIATPLLYIVVILLITGCVMTFLSVISAIVEVSCTTSLYNKNKGAFRKG